MRLWIAVISAILLGFGGAAYAQFNRCGFGPCPSGITQRGINPSGTSVPAPTGKILLADGVSFLLLTDGVSKLCRAGGC